MTQSGGLGEEGAMFLNHISVIALLLLLKKNDGTFSGLRPAETRPSRGNKMSSFSHGSKADVTAFRGMETETPAHCVLG